jgi:selenocysteine lyase/cysteine desulfurase
MPGAAEAGNRVSRAWDIATIRAEFPIAKNRAYLNNASIGPLSNPVVAAVDAFMHDVQQNGRNNYPHWCKYADNEIKTKIGRLIGATKDEIAFVKNTTEGLVNVANGLDWRSGDNVIIADIEYPSNVYCWMRLAKIGVEVRWVKSRSGRIAVDDIRQLIDSRTRLVSLSAVQFSNGFRLDLASLGELCRTTGVHLNLDGIQWIGALRMDLSQYNIGFLSAGGHKWLMAPIGTGIFYCRKDLIGALEPPNVGYHSVDKSEDHMDYDLTYRPNAGRFEEALVNFPGIWGLEAAVDILLELGSDRVEQQLLNLTGHAAEGLRKLGYTIISPFGENERSGILSFNHQKIDGEKIAELMAEAKVDLAVRGGALRISPTYYNDKSDIDRFLNALPH